MVNYVGQILFAFSKKLAEVKLPIILNFFYLMVMAMFGSISKAEIDS